MKQNVMVKNQISFKVEGRSKTENVKLSVKRGDVFWADLAQSTGSEQSGFRPVVVIQNDIGNHFSSTVIIACITSNITKAKLPTHVELGIEHGLDKASVVLCEQLRTIDKKRLFEKVTSLTTEKMKEIEGAIKVSLGL